MEVLNDINNYAFVEPYALAFLELLAVKLRSRSRSQDRSRSRSRSQERSMSGPRSGPWSGPEDPRTKDKDLDLD